MLKSNRMSLAVLTGELVKPVKPDVLLHGGETLDLAGLSLDVIHTPGHTKGGVCYALKSDRKLFVGDTLFLEGAGRTDFPGGSEKELYHSIADKLFPLEGDFDVYCGHEEDTTLEHERNNNPFVQMGAGAAGKGKAARTLIEIKQAVETETYDRNLHKPNGISKRHSRRNSAFSRFGGNCAVGGD